MAVKPIYIQQLVDIFKFNTGKYKYNSKAPLEKIKDNMENDIKDKVDLGVNVLRSAKDNSIQKIVEEKIGDKNIFKPQGNLAPRRMLDLLKILYQNSREKVKQETEIINELR